uniref:DUF8018 domain-containing protein n=1 Tax=Eriobotrya japonica TaxID=32224 RepID=A0A5Q3A4H3_9ROSA|nr:hypothetical protein [Eriobotrya japonica]QGI24987.1 hypothetical protein [Eriobotrya japonica]
MFSTLLTLLGSSVSSFLVHFLGSEGTARISAPFIGIALTIILICFIFLFRNWHFRKKGKGLTLKLFRIFILFLISCYFLILRFYIGTYLSVSIGSLLIFNVLGSGIITDSGPSGPSTPSSFTEDSFDVRVLLEPFSESETTGETSVNQGGSSRGSGWTSFDIGVLADSTPNEEGEEVAQPHPQNAPANPVASRGEEAGPSNWVPPEEKFPYHPDEVIGGDSVSSIERRLLAKVNSPSAAEIDFANIKAKDLFEIKVEIVRHMAGLDPEGDWLGRGARALDNPRTATGEPSLERLYALKQDLNRGGVQSEAFFLLKNKVLSKGGGVRDDNSMS